MIPSRYEAEADQKSKRLLCGVLIIIGVLIAAAVIFYAVTYSHPLVIGTFPTDNARLRCMNYAHDLMGNFLGIPIHAQIMVVTEPCVCRMVSLIPPWKTTVYASADDVPYWEHWK